MLLCKILPKSCGGKGSAVGEGKKSAANCDKHCMTSIFQQW